jgi:hypothetical protein
MNNNQTLMNQGDQQQPQSQFRNMTINEMQQLFSNRHLSDETKTSLSEALEHGEVIRIDPTGEITWCTVEDWGPGDSYHPIWHFMTLPKDSVLV